MFQQNTSQNIQSPIHRIEPGNWWIGMNSTALQLLVYGPQITHARVSIDYPGVSLQKITKVENPNYLFLDILIDEEAVAGIVHLLFTIQGMPICTYDYPLLNRESGSALRKGFDSGDAIYLIMPDRFANGKPQIDHIDGMRESVNRNAPYGRHGGDLHGILKHLNYIQEMGYTAIWLTPVMENNQPAASYHGYTITDFYKIDGRMGSNEDFKRLSHECNKRGIKIIMDMVFNHCGSYHWWINDLPMFSWINQWPEFTRSNNRLGVISDPYASESDKHLLQKGWFDTTMPDMNLENPLLFNYMTQNSIWWIEFAGLQGIRMDTFPYSNKWSLAHWTQRILKEYPNFNIVGECWINEASKLCYWQKDFPCKDGYNSHLPSIMDFPLQEAIKHAFNESEGWTTGMARLYNALANDHLYPNPMNLMVFPDNHDEGRIFHMLGNDIAKLKMALTYAATTRGILQIYYGTELLMDGNGWDGHDKIRLDFPGGWESDTTNAFTQKGRTKEQNKVFNHIKKLLNYRKQSEALKYGKTVHFIPQDGIYVYFRYTANQTVMVVLNNNAKGNNKIDTKRFKEIIGGFSQGTNIISGRKLLYLKTISIKAKKAMVIELK